MLEILEPLTADDIVAVSVSGKLTHQDYASLLPRLESVIEERGSVCCLVELTGMESVELRAIWDDLRFDLKHGSQVRRCALLAERRWQRWLARSTRLIFRNAEIRIFGPQELDRAAAWIRS